MMKWKNSKLYRWLHQKEIRQKEEMRRCDVYYKTFFAMTNQLCEEAMRDKEKYGEKPLFLDFGLYKIPVPLLEKGKQNGVRWYETKSGDILPEIVSVEKGEELISFR